MTTHATMSDISPTPVSLRPDDYERVVVLFANALGDQLLALPTLRSLGGLFRGRFTLLTVQGPYSLVFGDVPRARTIQIPISLEGAFDVENAAALLGPADLIVSPQTWHSPSVTGLLDRLAPAKSVGLDPRFDVPLPIDPARHQVDQMFDLCAVFGEDQPLDSYAHPFALPEISIDFAERLRSSLDGRRLLVLHTETKPEKQWPMDRWNEALHRFLDAHDDYVAVAVAKHLESLDGLTDRVLRITSLPIASAAAVIATADLFLGADSFPLHIADLWRVPGVALFGTSNLREYGFRFSAPMRHVDGAGSMDSIDVDSVVDAITSIARDSAGTERRYSLRDVLAPVVTLRYR